MKLYRNCKVYVAGDKTQKAVAIIDIESDGPLDEYHEWTSADKLSTSSSMTVTTTYEFDYLSRNHNIIIPDVGDLKITGAVKFKESRGEWKPRFRYRLSVTG